ncbi:hypothetical protein ACH4SP_36455 [Streptomyces sp. NPDC021093]|uniref:hypothetical protein n=1 Tax=Streptomyces sp. NPDC021093 TaxID=3365112 RepID=UPI0037895862
MASSAALFCVMLAYYLFAPWTQTSWGEMDWGKLILFSLVFGGMGALTTHGRTSSELTKSVNRLIHQDEVVKALISVRHISRGRKRNRLRPEDHILVLTNRRLIAFAQRRLTGSPGEEAWAYDRNQNITVELPEGKKHLTIHLPAENFQEFHVGASSRSEATRFVDECNLGR